jgi:TolB-like protein/Tfp pilus assembly protein PilF
MGENEDRALKNLKACRAITDEAIKNHHGRIFTTAGDSVIAEFASPVDAMIAAVEFQKNIKARNASAQEADQMQLRVGLNLGDLIVEDGNLYGDGVNIAARIEAGAEAGGIHMSAKFYEEVRRKLDLPFESLGDHQMKNIADPIATYRVNFEAAGEDAPQGRQKNQFTTLSKKRKILEKWRKIFTNKVALAAAVFGISGLGLYGFLQLVNKPSVNPLSIAVVPFANLTGDPSQAYVADGLTARVTTDLSRIRDAVVVDEATALQYRDKLASAQQVGRELGVRFVLKGDIQRSANAILINAKLMDSSDGKQLWSESFEGNITDLFALQDKVTMRISGSLGPQMLVVAATESEMKRTSQKVSDLILRARALQAKGNDIASLEQRVELFQQALAIEPLNNEVMVGLSIALGGLATRSPEQNLRADRFKQAAELAARVVEKDPKNKEIYSILALIAKENDDLLAAKQYAEKYYLLNPSSKSGIITFATYHLLSGATDKAIELLNKGISLDPLNPSEVNLSILGRSYLILGDVDNAIQYYLKAKQINPKVASTIAQLVVSYTMKGDAAKATMSLAELKKINPNTSLSNLITTLKPLSASPQIYKDWYRNIFLPAWVINGLTE